MNWSEGIGRNGMNKDLMFSSASSEWETPPEIFEPLNKEFGFILDVCATAENAKCMVWYDRKTDAMGQPWPLWGALWMNPPYGREIHVWVNHAYVHGENGGTIVCLFPSRTDTKWWHDYVMEAAEVRFIKGRIKFVGAPAPAPFPSVIVVFRAHEGETRFSSWDYRRKGR
jgi:site-specific DNA-methyltransferase (adenine-specific)